MGQLPSYSRDNIGPGSLTMESEVHNSNRFMILDRNLYTQKGGLAPGVPAINPPALIQPQVVSEDARINRK